jgi:MFS family permease
LFTDRGASAQAAALASSVAGLAVLVGRIATGYFLDRFFGPYVALVMFAGSACGVALLSIDNRILATAGAFLVGLAFGGEVDVIVFLMSRYFGLRHLGTAFGFAFGAFVLAGGVGPLLMGIGFDRTGSYRLPLAAFFVVTLGAAILITRLGPYRYETSRRLKGILCAF